MSACPRRSEDGFSLVGVAASIFIMSLLMGMAMPTWRYVMRNAREEELLFRGGQIADAVERYQKKHNAPPVSLEVLVKGKFLRQAFEDPMTEDGRWRFVRPGEAVGVPGIGGRVRPGQPAGLPTPSPTPTPRAGRGTRTGSQGSGAVFGPFIGVASLSKDKSLRVMNGKSQYDQWIFIAGQPRIVGKDATLVGPPGTRGPRNPRNPRDNPRPAR